MMIYVPVGLGIVLGIVMILVTKLLRKYNYALSIIQSIIGFVAVAVLIFISFDIRGFEGIAYTLLGITIFLFSLFSLLMAIINKKSLDKDLKNS